MRFTRLERRLLKEAEAIAELARVNFWDANRWEAGQYRQTKLRICINGMVVGVVVQWYTLLDEILADVICRYYFPKPNQKRHLLWNQKKFKTFVHYIVDEMYLLKKMEVAHAIDALPKEVRKTIQKANAIRNSLAHSFFPENRKEHIKDRRVLYEGKDIRSSEGLKRFVLDCHEAWLYLDRRGYGRLAEEGEENEEREEQERTST